MLVSANLPAPVASRSYIFEARLLNLLRDTIIIAAKFFVPLWSIAATFMLPVYFLQDLISWQGSEVISWLVSPFIWVGNYFTSFVIAGEVSNVCLGGTASFWKAMYKTSIKGVGRLLGTDMLFFLGLASVMIIGYGISAVFSLGNVGIVGDFAVGAILLCLTGWLFLFTTQVVAIERIYWFSALKRSASIAWKSKRRSAAIFVLFLLCWLVTFIAIPSLISKLVAYVTGTDILADMISSIATATFLPVPIIFLTLAYYSLRRLSGELSVDVLADIKAYEMS